MHVYVRLCRSHTGVRAHSCICSSMFTHVYTHVRTNTCTHVGSCACVCMFVHMHMCMCVCMYACVWNWSLRRNESAKNTPMPRNGKHQDNKYMGINIIQASSYVNLFKDTYLFNKNQGIISFITCESEI